MSHKTLLAALVAVLALSLSPARAADIYWTNTLGGNWGDAVNWSPNQVPDYTNGVFISAAGTYTVSGIGAFSTLYVGGPSGTQTVNAVGGGGVGLNGPVEFATNTAFSLFASVGGGANATVTIRGQMDWLGGNIEAPVSLTIASNATLNLAGPQNKDLNAAITNAGTIVWTGGDIILSFRPGGLIYNLPSGVFDAQVDAAIRRSRFSPEFVNQGLFRKSGGIGVTRTLDFPFYNTGTVEVQTGTFEWGGGSQNGRLQVATNAVVNYFNGVTTFGAANTNEIAGSFRVSGGIVNVDGNATVLLPNLTLSGGQIGGGGTWIVNGPFDWTSGGLDDLGVLNANSGIAISGNASKYLHRRTVNNGGTVTWSGSGSFNMGWGAIFNNPAGSLFDIQTDAGQGGAAAPLRFNNSGTFRKSAGSGTNICAGMQFYNTGTVELQTGAMRWDGGTYVQTAGTTLLNGGHFLFEPSGGLEIRGGLLGGTGTITGANISGQLSPGLSAGRIEMKSGYTQRSGGAFNCELGGTNAGASYDQVVIAANALLAGTINVVAIDGFTPAPGDRFEIMKFGSRSGSVVFNGLDIANGVTLVPEFSSTTLVLVATNAPLNAPPRMNLARNGDSLWCWWPQGYGTFNVQSATNLNPPIAWSPVSPTEANRHIFSADEPMQFFRMVQP